MQNSDLAQAISLCMSPNEHERQEGLKLLEEYKLLTGFGPGLLEISYNEGFSKEINQNAAVQLKNYVAQFWKYQGEEVTSEDEQIIVITNLDKEFIKATMLKVLPFIKIKANFKLYIQAIYKILKYDHSWGEFLPIIIDYLKSMDLFLILCGVTAFYQLSKRYEFEIDSKKDFYNANFTSVYSLLENLIDNIYNSHLQNGNLFFSDTGNYLMTKILSKILKIYLRTIQVKLMFLLNLNLNFLLF